MMVMTNLEMNDPGGHGRRRIAAADRAVKSAARAVWAQGDYHRFATQLIWDLGAELVSPAHIQAGQDVLDVACGTGNTALRAAAAGARVVACDLTPENFPPGQREAERLGLAIRWVEGDCEDLPFPDASFDVVASSVGAMWAPDHRQVANELLRVCRPGGTIAMINFAAGGLIEQFLAVFDGFGPPPGALSPVLWGDESHVRGLFGDRVELLEVTPGVYLERVAGGPVGYCEFYRQTFGPVVAIYAGLIDQPSRRAELDWRFLEFAARADRGRPGGDAELPFEYVTVVARKR